MSDTHTRLLYHIVFSTKRRERWIGAQEEPEVHPYMSSLMEKAKAYVLQINGMDDHIHVVVQLPPTVTVSKFVQDLKAYSSGWFKRRFRRSAFAWQRGYAAFTISPSRLHDAIEYVKNQKKHHGSGMTYEQELRSLLEKHGIDFDENHLL